MCAHTPSKTFEQSIKEAIKHKENEGDFVGEVMDLLDESPLKPDDDGESK